MTSSLRSKRCKYSIKYFLHLDPVENLRQVCWHEIFSSILSCCCYFANGESLLRHRRCSATAALHEKNWELATLLAAQLKAESCFSVEFKLRFGQDHVWVISTKILPKSAFTKVTIFKMKWRFLLVALTFYCSMVGTILLYFWLCNLKNCLICKKFLEVECHKIHWSVNYAISCHIISDCCHFWQRTKRFCFLLNFFMGTLCHSFCDWGHSLGLLISMERRRWWPFSQWIYEALLFLEAFLLLLSSS